MVIGRGRAISTVVDVTLALVLISGAVVMMAVFLQDEGSTHEPLTADRTAETVAGMTLGVHYDIGEVTSDRTEIEWPSSDAAYQRSRHGTAATLLADAAVANATYDGEVTTITGEKFEEGVDGRFRTRIAGAETNAHLTAVWRPYEGSSIQGVATAGPRPPPDEDVSSVTLTVPSGITLPEDVSTLHSLDAVPRSQVLAYAIVRHHFPEEATIHGLESQGIRRAMTVYRYYGFLEVVDSAGDFDHEDDDDPLGRHGADQSALNDEIAVGSSDSLANTMAGEQRSFGSDDEAFDEWLTVDEVEIIVRTWNP